MREPRELIEKCKKHLRDTKQYQHEYKTDIRKLITALEKAITVTHSRCGLTEIEYTERERLLEMQRSSTRWFSQQEFDRLKELSNKMFKNAGSPYCG